MPGREISLPPPGGQSHRATHLLLWLAGIVVVLATGIAIGTRLASPGHPTPQTVTEHAAPLAGAAQAPGRHANTPTTHTRTGAVAAAARSITTFAGTVLLEPTRLRALVTRIASRASRSRLSAAFAEASAQTRTKLGADTVPRPVILLRAVPAGYRVEQYSAGEATVAVWYVGIVGSGATVQPQQSWRTQTVTLVWENGTWKVSSFASTLGPTPPLATVGATEAPGELFAAIPRFQEFDYGAR